MAPADIPNRPPKPSKPPRQRRQYPDLAVPVYALVGIVSKRPKPPLTPHCEKLQILSLTLLEQTPLDQLHSSRAVTDLDSIDTHKQMKLFE
jgi:hypothetical protein